VIVGRQLADFPHLGLRGRSAGRSTCCFVPTRGGRPSGLTASTAMTGRPAAVATARRCSCHAESDQPRRAAGPAPAAIARRTWYELRATRSNAPSSARISSGSGVGMGGGARTPSSVSSARI
jgi:hypothetical protein